MPGLRVRPAQEKNNLRRFVASLGSLPRRLKLTSRACWRVDGRPEKATCLRLFTPLSIILTQAFSVVSYWLSVSIAFIFVQRVFGCLCVLPSLLARRVSGDLDLPSRSLG